MTETHYRRWPTCTAGPGPRVELNPPRDAISLRWLWLPVVTALGLWLLGAFIVACVADLFGFHAW